MKKFDIFPRFNATILLYLLEKEFKQMMRNIILPVVFILLPLGVVNMVPRVATQEVKNLKLAVVDNDHSTFSARLIQKMSASAFFNIAQVSATYPQALEEIEQGDADFIVEIQPDFERALVTEGESKVLVAANAVNGVKAGLGSSYLAQIISAFASEITEEMADKQTTSTASSFQVMPRYLFNTSLDYKLFMVPALMAMLLILTVGFLPALNIVGEKEKGTIEQINVTPVGKFDFILSKLIPYWCVGFVILVYAMVLAWAIYGFVPKGSIGSLFLFATLFILVVSSMGLIVSNHSDTTQQAALVMFFFLVIFLLMSGLITPVTSMPQWARTLTLLNPLRHFIEAIRALYMKGSTLGDLSTQLYALTTFATVTWFFAIKSYRKNN